MQQRVKAVLDRVHLAALAAGRDPAEIEVIAASKRQDAAVIQEAADAGIQAFGENYVSELLSKVDEVANARWHFIGNLQRNKARRVIPHVQMLHTLDTARLADALQRHLSDGEGPSRRLPVLIQVNIGGEPTKAGLSEREVRDLATHVLTCCPELNLSGLMTIPPRDDSDRWLGAMAQLRAGLQTELGVALPCLSMGMSRDLEAAIRHGATHVRVGTSIFGGR
ncbi:MAG: pyridoxal phosphate enzyme (YggS family) [Myxococcota bacterium]|jgi:pyridoxal phosphate enzyme (YggS family)